MIIVSQEGFMNSTDNAESVSSMLLGEVASSGLARGVLRSCPRACLAL